MTEARSLPAQLITRWATQAGREPAALSRERARLDTRGFADLLAEAAHLAGLVGFQEGERLIGGDWRGVLAADPTMVLALLATIDVEGRSEGLQTLLERARACADADEAKQLLGRLLEGLLRFAAELDEWLAPAAAGAALDDHAAHRMIEASIENVLAPMLRALLVEVAAAEEAGLLHNILPHRHRHRLRHRWRLAVIETEVAALRHEVERAWVDSLLDQVARVAEAFVQEMRDISERGAAALGPSLASKRHPAHVALVMAFARVFRHAQDRLNDVPQRLARFYHEEVLRQAPRAASPDSLFLTISPRPGARPEIAQGTLFAAGRDDEGAAVDFAADSPLAVTGAELAAVRLWTPARRADGRIARVDAAIFAVGTDGMVGDDASGLAASGTRVAVAPAAVITAPELRLAGGTRRVVLTLDCSRLPAAIIPAVLEQGLGVSVSTEQGWIDLGAAGVAVEWHVAAAAIELCVVLPPALPPLAPCPAGTADAPVEAAIRLTLRPYAATTLPLWTVFSGIILARATLQVTVRDLGDLVVSTPTGIASAEGAAPFGTPPYPGGWLRIDHPVLSGRPLDRLLLRMDWAGLPTGMTGFEGYYREYVIDEDRRLRDSPLFTNRSFAIAMAAPVPGWDAARLLPLFAPAGSAAPDILDPDERFVAGPPAPAPAGPLAPASWFAAEAAAGPAGPVPDHLFVTLVSPREGFGDAVYAANVAHATALLGWGEAPRRKGGLLHRLWVWIMALLKELVALVKKVVKKIGALLAIALRAPFLLIDRVEGFEGGYIEDWYDKADAEAERDPGPDFSGSLPNPPLRPLLSRIRLDYALTVSGSGLKLFHARPLETLRAVAGLAGAPLFAALPDRPAVDCGLAGAAPGKQQSLLVRLGPPRGQGREKAVAPEYFYMAAEGWRKLPAALLSDGTAGLSVTGILRVAFPADAAPIADEGWLWLRIVFPGGGPVPTILAVTPDALSATRILAGAAPALAPIPPATIAKPPHVTGIARVAQPLASAGGRPTESHDMLRRRTVERVRHRGRGVAAWDFERLVLSDFPEIAKVRVLGAGDPAAETPSGDVKVIVLPAPGGADPPDPDRPRASPQLRGAILKRLRAVASPFAKLDVLDPAYVAIDVTANVRVERDCAEQLEAALAAFLSPWAEPGLDLDDHSEEEAIRAAIAAFLLAQPGVAALDRLDVALDAAAPGSAWRVPVAGALKLVPIAAERAALPW